MKNRLFLSLGAALMGFATITQAQIPVDPGPFSPWPPYDNPHLRVPGGGGSPVGSASAAGATQLMAGLKEMTAGQAPGETTKVKIPLSIKATIPKAKISAAALGCASAFSNPLSAAACAASLAAAALELKNSGLGYGPCPAGSADQYAFICKSKPSTIPYVVLYSEGNTYPTRPGYATKEEACTAGNPDWHFEQVGAGQGYCYTSWGSIASSVYANNTCPSPYIWNSQNCQLPQGTTVTAAATPAEMEQTLQQRMDADFEASARLVAGMRADQARTAGVNLPATSNPFDANTPIEVTAPPVTTPARVTGTESISKPDGSIDQKTNSSQTTVTPNVTGTTAGTTIITYPSVTTTTSTITNNVTNVTTTNVTTTNNVTPEAVPSPFPTDYAREPTLSKVADALDTTGAPVLADQAAVVDEAKTKSDTDLKALRDAAATDQDTTDKGMWFSWVWTPPSGTCSPYSGVVHGYPIEWDLCPTIANIREVLGWLFALIASMTVYSQLFRKGE